MSRTYTEATLARKYAKRRLRQRAERSHPCTVHPGECYADPQSDAAASVCYDGTGPRPSGAYHTYRSERANVRVQAGRAGKYSALAALDVRDLLSED